uniref:Uncharacterized protein n=1 Tax=Glossina morsitans morsitans TaxID=37546 RepID=D3TKJ6_GLOMM
MPARQKKGQGQQHFFQHLGAFRGQKKKQKIPEGNGFFFPPKEEGVFFPTHTGGQKFFPGGGLTNWGGGFQPNPSKQLGRVPPIPPNPPFPQQKAPPPFEMGFFFPPPPIKKAEALGAVFNTPENQRFFRFFKKEAFPPPLENFSPRFPESKGKKKKMGKKILGKGLITKFFKF